MRTDGYAHSDEPLPRTVRLARGGINCYCQELWQKSPPDVQQRYMKFESHEKKIWSEDGTPTGSADLLDITKRHVIGLLDLIVQFGTVLRASHGTPEEYGVMLQVASQAHCTLGGAACLADIEYELHISLKYAEAPSLREYYQQLLEGVIRSGVSAGLIAHIWSEYAEACDHMHLLQQRRNDGKIPHVFLMDASGFRLDHETLKTQYYLYHSFVDLVTPTCSHVQ